MFVGHGISRHGLGQLFHIVFIDDPVDDGEDENDKQDGNQASQDAQQPCDSGAATIDEID